MNKECKIGKPKIVRYELVLRSYFQPDNIDTEALCLHEGMTLNFCDYTQKALPNTISEKMFDEMVYRFKSELISKGLITKEDNYIV